MPQTTTASAVFSNHRAAQRAVHRLASGGFARSSINAQRMYSDDDSYEVSVRVKEGNVERAEDLLHAREDVHEFAGNRGLNLQPVMIAAGAVLLGAVGYALLARRSPQPRRR
jgi:hypothetical protein